MVRKREVEVLAETDPRREDATLILIKRLRRVELELKHVESAAHEATISARKLGLDEMESDLTDIKEQQLKQLKILSNHINKAKESIPLQK